MNNHMTEVAKLLGVELDEVFFVKEYQDYPNSPKTYLKFTENGLENSVDLTSWTKTTSWMWEQLITGALKINKLPWKPSRGDEYWTPVVNQVAVSTLWSKWSNNDNDRYRYEHGLICRTKKEAVELTEKLLAVAKEEKEK